MVEDKGNERLVAAHDAYWSSEAEMAEGNPQAIVASGDAARLPTAILIQGLADDNVTPDMADRFTAAWKARGGGIELHKFEGMPHTFIVNRPTDPASARATELVRDFIVKQAKV